MHPLSLFTHSKTGLTSSDKGVDDHLTDIKQSTCQNELDSALAATIELLEEYDDIFAASPKNPGTSNSIERKIETTGVYHPHPLCIEDPNPIETSSRTG